MFTLPPLSSHHSLSADILLTTITIIFRSSNKIKKMLSSCNCNTIIFSFPINKLLLKQKQKQRQTVLVAASIHHDSLRVLEWDKLSDLVSSFATTSLGRHALKVPLSLKSYLFSYLYFIFLIYNFIFMKQDQLWSQNQTYQESLKLLQETNAAVEMHKHGSCRLHFGHIDAIMVGN